MPADEALERKRLRRSTRVGRGRLAWDKDRTRELFRRYKEEGDEEAREQLIVAGPHQGYRPLRS